jgi:hypothetical protein
LTREPLDKVELLKKAYRKDEEAER